MMEFVDKEKAQKRYDECKKCEEFLQVTKQCKICLCYMPLKVKFENNYCPMQKW